MRFVRHTLLLCFICLSLSQLLAQLPSGVFPCATPAVKSDWLSQFQNRQHLPQLRSEDRKYIAVTIHIVGTDEGKEYLNGNTILDALCMLNEKFAPADIHFFIKGSFNYIDNSLLYAHDKSTFPKIPNLFSRNNVEGTINVYFVGDPMGACGYNYMPNGKSMAIVLSNDCTNGKDANWAHEMGHYLALPHTFFGWEMETPDFSKPAPYLTKMGVEVEMADSSNSTYAGDGFFDTPADYLSGRWYCDNKGISSIKQMDPNGTNFCSDGSYIMSYSMDNCAAKFSPSQIGAMHSYLSEELHNYFMVNPPCAELGSPTNILEFPSNKAVLNAPNRKVALNWRQAENAFGYVVEVSLLANFGTVVFRGISYGTSIEVGNLTSTRSYYWRVRPFNALFSCKTYSASRSFSINQATALPVLNSIHELELFPNPILSGEAIRLRFDAEERMSLQVSLVNALGEEVYQQPVQVNVGNNDVRLRAQLPVGMYWIWLKGEKGTLSRKLIIH